MIDTMLFVADLPAGTYAAGDTVTLKLHTGPAVVRDGLGTPVLKNIQTGTLFRGSSVGYGPIRYKVKNSNWNDPVYNGPASLSSSVAMLDEVTGMQNGNDCELQVNSAFEVEAEFYQASTTTVGNTIFCTIDIEYSNNSGLVDPRSEKGTPCSILYEFDALAIPAVGNTMETATWIEYSFDSFKAGYRYLLQKMSMQISGDSCTGFVKISGGASMGGLCRIIPITSLSTVVAKTIKYTSPEVKGPFNLGLMLLVEGSGASYDVELICDYVKR